MTFRAYLLKRAEIARTRRYLRRSSVDDICLDFAQDCAENPDRVPTDDADLYKYLDKHVGRIELGSDLASFGYNASFTGTALEWLWHRYLRAGL